MGPRISTQAVMNDEKATFKHGGGVSNILAKHNDGPRFDNQIASDIFTSILSLFNFKAQASVYVGIFQKKAPWS